MNTLRSISSRSFVHRTMVMLLACLLFHGSIVRAQSAGIPQSFGNRLVGAGIVASATVDATCPVQGEKAATIRDVVSFNIDEENPSYLPDNFTATVTVDIDYGDNSSSTTRISAVSLTVNYSKDAGVSYDTKKYISFAGARYVKATVTAISVTPATLSNQVSALSVLTLKSEIQATLYFDLNPNLLPASLVQPPSPCSSGTATTDELPIAWSWPAGAVNNGTQVEWTFVPGDVTDNYFNSDGSPNYSLLFKNNSTRVDLPLGISSYTIPLFYDGAGTLYYRIRAVNNLPSGSRTDGPWANGQPVPFCGHSPALNWQVNTSFAEDGKRKTVMQYYDGSLRMRQTVTKDNSTNTTLTAETFYDGQGRPAIQILPAPGINNIVAYTANLNTFNTQAPGTDPAALFDLQPISGGNNATPPLSTATGTALYYNAANPETSQNGNGNIPDGGGYPYTVTRYTPDATGRIMTQSGVGPAMKMTSGHETKYFYGNAPQEQLDGLFGTEVGISPHYFKNMVQDANGQMSVSYMDMHGRTIATALAGVASPSLKPLDLTQYPGQTPQTLTQNLLPTGGNIVKGNSLESLNTLLVPVTEPYSFTYSLTPDALTLQNCQATQSICYDCMYNLEITITDESGDTDPIVRRFDNVSLSSANVCPPGNALLADDDFSSTATSGVSGNTITFSQLLTAGSYSVRKTLTVSDVARQSMRDQYVTSGLCKDEQGIIDSIYNVLQAQTSCAVPKGPCQNCGVNTLDLIQSQMLEDMMPFTGQYAKDPSTVVMSSTSYNAYDIFASGHFRTPTGGNYLDAAGNPDASISSATLSTVTPADYEGLFAPSWAQQLLPFHPEYNELLFAQQHLVSSYAFIDGFNSVTTYGTSGAYQNQYNTTEDLDPFFALWPAMRTYMHNLSSVGGYYNGFSLWQIAYGGVTCTTNPDPGAVNLCYESSPVSPQYFGSLPAPVLNQIWNVYQSLYTSVRDSLVNIYILNNGSGPNQTALVNDHYILRFPSSTSQIVTQYNLPGFPTTGGAAPTVSLTDLAAAAQSTQCSSYIDRWKQALLQCPVLAARSDAQDILTEITNRMVAVCERGQDPANPYGSSSVAPANIINGGDNSFEDVINNVFAEKGIPISQLCNPFAIDFPKPYGKNPQMIKEMMAVVDKCACDQFAKLKLAAGVSTFPELNAWLLANYGDTLTQVEFDAMQNCSIIGQTICTWVNYNMPQNSDGSCPCTLTPQGGTQAAAFVQPVTDVTLPPVTNPHICFCNQQVCRTIDAYPLSSPQPKPAFLDCGFSGYNHCLTCSQLSGYVTSYKALFAGQPCAAAPVIGTTDLTSDQIGYNVTFAQYVNYMSGLQKNWTDYVNAAAATSCNLALANTGANQTVICGNTTPLSDPTALIETEDPCQKTHQMAIAMGEDIYQQRVAALQTSFDQWYNAKCLSTTETFNVNYQQNEFHYTLYYYDQAGNLLKTVPPKGARPNFSTAFINSVEVARTTGDVVTPAHLLPTDYRYNSLNLVTAQHTPDANTAHFWYDNLGRLVVSQNAQQAVDGKYSYTIYDAISRIIEVGQKPQSSPMSQTISQSPSSLSNWLVSSGGTREQVTSTGYDKRADFITRTDLIDGVNLRNRVSYTTTQTLFTDAQWNATIYSYDVHGNVDTVLQDYLAVSGMGDQPYKRITYDYDLVSNKVNGVDYQHGMGQGDDFYHRYRYDAENRLVQVLTSRDSIFWEQEAAYDYYKHGPLARTVLGQLQTQELRYSYTLQGWLKGINSGGLFNYVPPAGGSSDGSNCTPGTYPDNLVLSSRPASGGPAIYTARSSIDFEPGFAVAVGDAMTAIVDPNAAVCVIQSGGGTGGIIPTDPLSFPIAQDAYNFSLHYYPGDYTPISATTPVTGVLEAIPAQAAPLYNGNIAAMAVNLPLGLSTNTKVYNYHYDQLNRLVSMDAFDGLNTTNHTFSPVQLSDYKEQVTYDPNGNILSYNRNGYTGGGTAMDVLTYNYNHPATNQLSSISDAGGGTYTTDIKDQGTGDNYHYDQIGNLILDGTNTISWTVYGKIATQSGLSGAISYAYDASSNRITKTTSGGTTLYVRDAQGNVLSTYQQPAGGAFAQSEIDLFGSSRLGLLRSPTLPTQTIALSGGGGMAYVTSFTRGLKSYELSNHLGNVLATITDKKIAVSSGSNSSLIDHFTADVVTAQDYYPFGMIMPGRSFVAAGGANYRYGFNGQENVNEIAGVGNHTTAEFWEYDPRIGRRWNLDPKPSPELSEYAAFGNNPIFYSDPLGDTVVLGAGGEFGMDIKDNSLEFYGSSDYYISGTKTRVPVAAGQLRSFTNELGTFSATWNTNEDGQAVFAGYKNDHNMTVQETVDMVKRWTTGLRGVLFSAYSNLESAIEANPAKFNYNVTVTLLTFSAMGSVDPVPSSAGYNPSVTLSEGVENEPAFQVVTSEAVASRVVLNNKGVPYPQVAVDGYGLVPFPEGPYMPNNSSSLRPSFTTAYKEEFRQWWVGQGRKWPTAPEGSVINIHHIKPLSKGGTNAFENLIPLVQPEQHQPFTNWWRGF